ncbi:hypothetical protein BV20DRAFT_789014 [Pilatotrama ljubarskyi]|nr:hypothetical protein BV20DRAFT_789014 [Pilatotrama ljubarskyi]
MPRSCAVLAIASIVALNSHAALGRLINHTIDDEHGDSLTGALPVYSGDIFWNQGSRCTGCYVSPDTVDIHQVFDGTWHDTTSHSDVSSPAITATFTGVAVYVFNMLANNVSATTTVTSLAFAIDGEHVGSYTHAPDLTTSQILYNVPVYTNTALGNGKHTIEIFASQTFSSLILFDYIVYTSNEADRASSHEVPSVEQTSSSALEYPWHFWCRRHTRLRPTLLRPLQVRSGPARSLQVLRPGPEIRSLQA